MAIGAGRFSPTIRASARFSGAWCAKPDDYLADLGQRLASGEGSKDALDEPRRELALWEDAATGEYLTGELSAVDLTVYPFLALFLRLASRRADFVKDDVVGPRLCRLDRSHAEASHR